MFHIQVRLPECINQLLTAAPTSKELMVNSGHRMAYECSPRWNTNGIKRRLLEPTVFRFSIGYEKGPDVFLITCQANGRMGECKLF